MTTDRQIAGYEFLLEHHDGSRTWAQIMGNGGAMGNGALATANHRPSMRARIRSALLSRCRQELAREGTLLVVRSADGPPADRHVSMTVARVLRVRAVYIRPRTTPSASQEKA